MRSLSLVAARLLVARLQGCWLQAASKASCKAAFLLVPFRSGSSKFLNLAIMWGFHNSDFENIVQLGRTYERILDFSFRGRRDHGHEVAFELVSGADFRCVLHHLSSLTR